MSLAIFDKMVIPFISQFQKFVGVLVALSLVLGVWTMPAVAQLLHHHNHHKCDRCGCECTPLKVCVPKEETKKVSKTEYGCECEDFCVPGRSTLIGTEQVCDEHGHVHCKKIWQPTCATVRSKNVLTKKTVEVEETVCTWEVQEICDACAQSCQESEIITPAPAAEPIPQPGPAAQPETAPTTQKSWLPIFQLPASLNPFSSAADSASAISPNTSSRQR